VSDRGLPIADGAHACPFVAFDDDRDERADVPDHRHRCFADSPPAPRALAHQEAYCLSSAFPVCPTFQDWARREAAKSRGGSVERTPTAADAAIAAAAGAAAAEASHDPDEEDASGEPPPPRRFDDGEAVRNPPREWSAPPPWLASAEAAAGREPSEPPTFLASRSNPGQGLAGSTADQWAGGAPPSRPSDARQSSTAAAAAATAAAAAAGTGQGSSSVGRGAADDYDDHQDDGASPPPRRPRAYNQHLGGPSSGPDWERPRRYEAYPTIRTRVGLPGVPRLALMAVALGIAAVAVFFLPALLGLGSPDAANATPSPTPLPSRSIEPTPTPEPTPTTYVIQSGDTLSKIASEHGVTLDQLMAANPAIKDPNKIAEGQQIIIPTPETAPEPIPGSAEPSAGASP
jgi:nucleoid-associated protein YgaU